MGPLTGFAVRGGVGRLQSSHNRRNRAEICAKSAQVGGEAIAGIDGVKHHVGPGDLLFFPPDVFHSVTALSERITVLVIYSPP